MIEQLQYQLKSVRLSGMAEHLSVRLQEAKANDLPYDTFLQNLLDDELSRRRERLLDRRMKQARFPYLRSIDEFDFSFNPGILILVVSHNQSIILLHKTLFSGMTN